MTFLPSKVYATVDSELVFTVYMSIFKMGYRHERWVCPVGQGGFAVESIGGYTVVYDCGSVSSQPSLDFFVNLILNRYPHVDALFLSHFDKDHVNGLNFLLQRKSVLIAYTPVIDKELEMVFDVYYNGAYNAIMQLLRNANIPIQAVSAEGYPLFPTKEPVWEWIAKSMMNKTDFTEIKTKLESSGIDDRKLKDARLLEQKKEMINTIFKSVFGKNGPNAKGLIVLSQHCQNVKVDYCRLYQGYYDYYFYRFIEESDEPSSCLYVGDANLKKKKNLEEVKDFWEKHRTEDKLLLMQLPHHGSSSNNNDMLPKEISAHYYFVNDKDSVRIQRNKALHTLLKKSKLLLMSTGNPYELIASETRV